MNRTDWVSFPMVLTAADISEILKISKPSAYELMKRDDFPLIKIGRCKRVLKEQFFVWLNTNTNDGVVNKINL